jgi:hypothetical protein
MVTYGEALLLQEASQDFYARMFVLAFYGIILLLMWWTIRNWKSDSEWKRFRNFIGKYALYWSSLFYPLLVTFMLMAGASMNLLVDILAKYYQIGAYIGVVLSIIFFYDLILEFFATINKKLDKLSKISY